MRTGNFIQAGFPPEPAPFDLFLTERAKLWAKSANLQWDVLIHFPTFRQNALEEWNLLQKESKND